MRKVFRCAWCLQLNEIFIDISAGDEQDYVEDCQVCCRPNVVHIHIDEELAHIEITNEAEG